MITGWILVVLQATTLNNVQGWQHLGEFQYKSDCEDAIIQLRANYVEREKSPMKYLCIRQSKGSK